MMRNLVMLALIFVALPARAQSGEEKLITTVPEGYDVLYHDRVGNAVISQFAPSSETLTNWSELTTVQIFDQSFQIDAFKASMDTTLRDSCPASTAPETIDSGDENG